MAVNLNPSIIYILMQLNFIDQEVDKRRLHQCRSPCSTAIRYEVLLEQLIGR